MGVHSFTGPILLSTYYSPLANLKILLQAPVPVVCKVGAKVVAVQKVKTNSKIRNYFCTKLVGTDKLCFVTSKTYFSNFSITEIE